MNTRLHVIVLGAAGLGAALAAAPAFATPAAPSAPAPSLALSLVDVAPVADATIVPAGYDGTVNESIRYRPRWRQPQYYNQQGPVKGYFEIHGGFFNPEQAGFANGAVGGVRLGSNIENRVQIGVDVDVSHRSDRQSSIVGTGTLPGGGTAERRVDLSEASSNLMPVQAFLQISPGGGRSGGPYVGISGGYEALFLHATNFQTGQDFDATYDGWGWQFYGGFAFPVTSQVRFNVEGFGNQGDLDRKVHDSGVTYREVVNVNGAGMRGGFSWSF